jgi:hypothetical protein
MQAIRRACVCVCVCERGAWTETQAHVYCSHTMWRNCGTVSMIHNLKDDSDKDDRDEEEDREDKEEKDERKTARFWR